MLVVADAWRGTQGADGIGRQYWNIFKLYNIRLSPGERPDKATKSIIALRATVKAKSIRFTIKKCKIVTPWHSSHHTQMSHSASAWAASQQDCCCFCSCCCCCSCSRWCRSSFKKRRNFATKRARLRIFHGRHGTAIQADARTESFYTQPHAAATLNPTHTQNSLRAEEGPKGSKNLSVIFGDHYHWLVFLAVLSRCSERLRSVTAINVCLLGMSKDAPRPNVEPKRVNLRKTTHADREEGKTEEVLAKIRSETEKKQNIQILN